VLFVTGRCERSCFYCPLSSERKGRDLVYADETRIEEISEILEEGRAIDALGTGITGGEPLDKLDYVLECIRALKAAFGSEHHIHLYTGMLPGRKTLQRLREAGLDEIRFHPPPEEWSHPGPLTETLREAKSLGLLAGVEIPAVKEAPAIVQAVKDAHAFLNINELEFSETNYAAMAREGFMPVELGCAALGSEETARRHFLKADIRAHYCPSRFKDAVQLRERLLRRAKRNARPFDCIGQDGTIIHGTIEGEMSLVLPILEELGVPEQMYCLRNGGIDIAAAILEDIAGDLQKIDCSLCLVERYPLPDGIVVERIHL
jgi:pyruvate formate-lyase activating enzyme-like uncharacterized protein